MASAEAKRARVNKKDPNTFNVSLEDPLLSIKLDIWKHQKRCELINFYTMELLNKMGLVACGPDCTSFEKHEDKVYCNFVEPAKKYGKISMQVERCRELGSYDENNHYSLPEWCPRLSLEGNIRDG